MARVALDAMGGDHAPAEIVAGALEAAGDPALSVMLVGDGDALGSLVGDAPVDVVHAPETIGMDEDPAHAIREKRNASVAVAARLVADGAADGLVSAGSTGATLAAATLILGRLKGVLRPAIAALLPLDEVGKVLVDAGANPECKPEHLRQFAVMGSALAEARLAMVRPRVALLNIGAEQGKGRDLERAAFALMAETPINFVGNVEARDVAGDAADVIVTDGFTGNVMLKAGEGTVSHVGQLLLAEFAAASQEQPEIAAAFGPRLVSLRERLDPESYGGASLLGVKGAVTISHGSSSRRAIANALRFTAREIEHDLVGKISAGLDR